MKSKTQHLSLSGNDKIELISNMTTMLSAGIPILETVDSLLEDSKGNQKKILENLRNDLMQGNRVYASFAKFPNIFNKVTINIIKAAEEAGTLDESLKDLKDNIKKEMEFSDKVRTALMYPVIVLAVFVIIMLVMLTFVVPRIATVFKRLKVDLPLPTQILIYLSDAILLYTIPSIIVVVLLIVGGIFMYKRQKQLLIQVFTSLPLVSELVKQIDLTRFSHSLYLLLSSGIPITSALELTEDVVIRKDISKAILQSKDIIIAGKKLSEGFKNSRKIFPNIFIKITEAGEKTGSLDKSMQEVSEHMDYKVTNTLRTLTALLEPIMLVAVGFLVGGMMVAIIAPIYGLIGSVGGGSQ